MHLTETRVVVVPDKLKTAKVKPIYEKKKKKKLILLYSLFIVRCRFYRVFSKILERLVFDRCVNYINDQEILNDKRYDFRPKHSTDMAIAQLVDKITNAVEKMKPQLEYF